MKLIEVEPDQLVVAEELRRSGSAKQFEERLKSSIEQIGLAEPIKVARMPSGQFLVVDGTMRLRAISAIRQRDASAFSTIPAYLTDYERRYEIRYQTDIYQDLLPSQLASLVEHLHQNEGVKKVDIARYIGVSPATLRNYTGLWRLISRGGLFERLVELMDVGIFPSSNPFAWLRLDPDAGGLSLIFEQLAQDGEAAEAWVERMLLSARQGSNPRYTTVEVETMTGGLSDEYYRGEVELRQVKQDLGTRRGTGKRSTAAAVRRLNLVTRNSPNPVLRSAAASLKGYLK